MTETKISTRQIQAFLPRSLARIGIYCLYSVLLTGCVGASNWLSGAPESQHSSFATSHDFASMRIGVTSAQEIASRFGVPDDVQFGSIEGRQIESLGYASNEQTITPFQYIPLLGAIEIWRERSKNTPSAAVSFSPEARVSGLTISSNNAYGDIRSPRISARVGFSISMYGTRNPAVSYTANASSEPRP